MIIILLLLSLIISLFISFKKKKNQCIDKIPLMSYFSCQIYRMCEILVIILRYIRIIKDGGEKIEFNITFMNHLLKYMKVISNKMGR